MRAPIVFALIALVPLAADAKPKGKAKGKGAAKADKKGNPKAEAKKHMDKAAKLHKAGKYDEALDELQAAYDIDPQTKLLFAIAQVQQKLDRCGDAIPNYEKFLEAEKDKKKQAVVKQAIEACNQKVAAATPPPTETTEDALATPASTATTEPAPVEPTPPPTEPTPAPVPETDDSPFGHTPSQPASTQVVVGTAGGGKPWYKDVLGDALVVSGVAAGVVGVLNYTGATSALDDAESASSLHQYQSLVDDAHDKRMYAVVFGGAGAVLITAGILRYKLRDNGESHRIAITPKSGGGLVTWSGGF